MPGLKNAGKDGAVGFVHEGRSLEVCFNVTAVHRNARMKVVLKGRRLWKKKFPWNPGSLCSERLRYRRIWEEKEVSAFFFMTKTGRS